jgi:hypothetical protein
MLLTIVKLMGKKSKWLIMEKTCSAISIPNSCQRRNCSAPHAHELLRGERTLFPVQLHQLENLVAGRQAKQT